MEQLQQLATSRGSTNYRLLSGEAVQIETWTLHFKPAIPPKLPAGILKSTYVSKPLVDVDGDSLFGELAIVRWLAKGGWIAFWADTFHGRKFWLDMPHRSEPVEPPASIRALYSRISELNGGPSGCFDVVASKGGRIIWLEYKGPKDRPNANEARWIEAALRAGVRPSDLIFVGDRPR